MPALINSIKNGYGLETDLRDYLGEVFISHDPIVDPKLKLKEFLETASDVASEPTTIAFNIKADGLAQKIKKLVDNIFHDSVFNVFYFDASVPDSISYINRNMQTYNRLSEYETAPAFDTKSSGSWIDSFDGSYDQLSAAKKVLAVGKSCALVSPELHGREHIPFWESLRSEGTNFLGDNLLYLCTDYPDEAYSFFRD